MLRAWPVCATVPATPFPNGTLMYGTFGATWLRTSWDCG